ncbi:MAG: hypothetical protein ACYCOO_00565 [Chitinophagaceae bacterium]
MINMHWNTKKISGCLVAAMTILSLSAFGQQKAKTMTVKGELLDMDCYMGHGAHGASHKECAETCIKGGAPMGILGSNGKVYLLVENHDHPAPYAAAKKFAGDQVEVTGTYADRGGVQGLVVNSVKGGM